MSFPIHFPEYEAVPSHTCHLPETLSYRRFLETSMVATWGPRVNTTPGCIILVAHAPPCGHPCRPGRLPMRRAASSKQTIKKESDAQHPLLAAAVRDCKLSSIFRRKAMAVSSFPLLGAGVRTLVARGLVRAFTLLMSTASAALLPPPSEVRTLVARGLVRAFTPITPALAVRKGAAFLAQLMDLCGIRLFGGRAASVFTAMGWAGGSAARGYARPPLHKFGRHH
mmetsp:Transcript_109426/g.340957  ORF Transcript_109426/g.340957 Transcript_109426/m.340957 type:complete len:225 (+) Transcript_109426:74-748(+)